MASSALQPISWSAALQHLVGFLAELHALRIDLYLHQQHVDTTTPAGRALFGMMSVFAEFEPGHDSRARTRRLGAGSG